MSYTRFGRYPINRDFHSTARTDRRQAYLSRGRTIPISAATAAEVVNMAAASGAAPNSVAQVPNAAALNLPVPKKRKKTQKVTRKTLLRDVQSLKNKFNKRELKVMGISYKDTSMYTYAGNIPTLTEVDKIGSIFISQPCQQNTRAPVLVQGTGNGERIGDKVYYVTARYRLCFTYVNSNFLTNRYPGFGQVTGLPTAGTATGTAPWTGSYTGIYQTTSPQSSAGVSFPIRVVSLAIREDYLNSIVTTNSRDRLRLSDVFTTLEDWDGNYTTTDHPSLDGKIFLYSRKVKNEAAGKVRIKSDNIYYISSASAQGEVLVFDKNVPIRQQYSFEAGKTDGWVHGVLFQLCGISELKKFIHNYECINWSSFSNAYPLLKMDGGACYYYYDD